MARNFFSKILPQNGANLKTSAYLCHRLVSPKGMAGQHLLVEKDVYGRYLWVFKSRKFDFTPQETATQRPRWVYDTYSLCFDVSSEA